MSTVTGADRVPVLRGAERSYYEAAKRHELQIGQCTSCASFCPPARLVCPACGDAAIQPVRSAGLGNVHSFTVVYRAAFRSMADQTPYVVALIDLAEGVRLLANIVGCPPADVHVGAPVAVTFESLTDDFVVPQFTLIKSEDH